MSKTATAQVDELGQPTAPTTKRAVEVARNALDETAAKAENVEQALREKAAVAGEKVEATQELASEKIERSIAEVESFVKKRPFAAAGIAFAAGFVATSLLRR